MNDPSPTANEEPCWPHYRIEGWKRAWLRMLHRLPPAPPFRHLALWLRKPLKRLIDHPVDLTVWGLKLRLWPLGNLSEQRLLFMPQFVDRAERKYLEKRFHGPSGCFLDIGANAGLYTLWAASLKPAIQIESFEPDNELCDRLRANLDRNGLSGVHLHRVALGNPELPATLVRNQNNLGENRIVTEPLKSNRTVAVKSLLTVLAERKIDRVDIVKIDVEGHELKILEPFFRDAPDTLWPRAIICELPRNNERHPLALLLEKHSYVSVLRTRMNGIFELNR